MNDPLAQLEAAQAREERSHDLLLTFVQEVAAGRFTKGRAVIRAKSLLRDVANVVKASDPQP